MVTRMPAEVATRIASHLRAIYGSRAADLLPHVVRLIKDFAERLQGKNAELWSERDVALIMYGDQIAEANRPTLVSLDRFLVDFQLDEAFSLVHILPFCPYSSDDGFSVIDFRRVDEKLGDWNDLTQLATRVDLMYDLVLNHVSQHSDWFQGYLRGDKKFSNWFLDVDPSLDLSEVTRPRSHPLLTPFATADSERHIWTTFSADQIDLNYAEPDVLLEMLDILLEYVAGGGRVIRLDAIAFLWKEIGTTCLHLRQTHAVVKLFRAVLDAVAPGVLLLTETNVPHEENISYFGDGDEAHMVYNFSLPPLLLDAYVNGEATPLQSWLNRLDSPPVGTTWFNFTASHDGIGVRPLEGIVDEQRLQRLIDATRERGGEVSMRRMASGEQRAYELNITWCDAMRMPDSKDPLHVQRMLASQAFMLALQGVPATYFHSLVGTPNDLEGMRESGQARRINRRKYDYDELCELLARDSMQAAIFAGYVKLLRTRRCQPAFHPDAAQRVIASGDTSVVAFERTSLDGDQTVIVAANFSNQPKIFVTEHPLQRDLIAETVVNSSRVTLAPYQIVWLETKKC